MINKKTESDSTDNVLAGCGYAILLILVSPVTTIWRGYVLSILWRWFIVTAFDVRPLGIASAIGISYVAGFLTFHYRPSSKNEKSPSEKFTESVVILLLYPLIALGFSYVVHLYI